MSLPVINTQFKKKLPSKDGMPNHVVRPTPPLKSVSPDATTLASSKKNDVDPGE